MPTRPTCSARSSTRSASVVIRTTALRLVQLLRRHSWMRARSGETLARVLPVIELPEVRDDPKLLGEAIVSLALVAIYVDLETARRLAERAVELGRELDDAPLLVTALRALAYTYMFGGDPEAGLPIASESAERARALGDDVLLGESLVVCMGCARTVDAARADAALREGLACLQRTNDLYMSAILRNNASVGALHAGDIAAAREHLELAREASEATGVASFNVRGNLGMVLREEGDLASARELVENGLRISRRAGDRYGLGYSLLCLALIAGDQNDWERAAELHGAAQSFLDQIGQPWLALYYAKTRDSSVDATRVALGENQFQRLYDRGYKLGSNGATRLAFRDADLAGTASE